MRFDLLERIKSVARGQIVKYATDKEISIPTFRTTREMYANVGIMDVSDQVLCPNVNCIIHMLQASHALRPIEDTMIGMLMGSMGYFDNQRYINAQVANTWLKSYYNSDIRFKARENLPSFKYDEVSSKFLHIPDKEYLQLVFDNVRYGMALEMLNYKDIYNLLMKHGYLRSHLKDASLQALVAKFSTRTDPEWERERKQKEAIISEIERCFLDRVRDEKLSFLVDDKDDGRA